MKRFIKKLFIVIGFAVIAYSIANYKLIIYGMQQLKGQLHIIFNTVPVEEVIIKKTVSEQYIAKLLLIQKIRIRLGHRDAQYVLEGFIAMDEDFFEEHRKKS